VKNNIEIGRACIVRERTNILDRGSYVGVIVDIDARVDDVTVYVMNDNGVFPTKEHCVIVDPVYIGNYYDELKEEYKRLQKVSRTLLKSMKDTGNLFIWFCYKWDDYVKTNIPSKYLDFKIPSKDRLDQLKKLTVIQENKKNLLSKYESQMYYLENLMQDIEMHLR